MKIQASSIVNPRTILFLTASLNLLWFLAHSQMIQGLGSSTKISFCVVCPWYWDLWISSPPVLSCFATGFLLFGRVTTDIFAGLISVYEVVQGYFWVVAGDGFPTSVFDRIEILRTLDSIAWWELLDLQYAFALVIFVATFIYLVAEIVHPVAKGDQPIKPRVE